MNFFQFTRIVIQLSLRILYQKKYNKRQLLPLLDKMQLAFGQQLPLAQLKKVTHYYCLLLPPVICENFTRIAGRKFTEGERYKAVLMGIIAPIFDDFFDDKNLTNEGIRQITLHPDTYPVKNISEYVFQQCHGQLLNTVNFPAAYGEMVNKIMGAQFDSQKQFDPAITDKELTRITFEKGTYSFLIFHSILDHQPGEAMKELIRQLSGLLQLANDIFDIYKDLRSGITTLPNRTTDFKQFRKYFIKESIRFNTMAHALPSPKNKIIPFIVAIQLVISRGLVALDQLERLTNKYALPIQLNSIPRKELVCDMELWGNRLNWMKYAYRMSKTK